MSEIGVIFDRYGDFILLSGIICFFFGIGIATIEFKKHGTDELINGYLLFVLASSVVFAELIWAIEPLRYFWGAATLGASVTIVVVVGLYVILSLSSLPINPK